MRLLVTRPEPDATRTAETLRARGHDVLVAPLLATLTIAAEVAGDHFDVFVAHRPVIRVQLDFEGALAPVFEAVHAEFIETFTLETNDFLDARFKGGIGFLPG